MTFCRILTTASLIIPPGMKNPTPMSGFSPSLLARLNAKAKITDFVKHDYDCNSSNHFPPEHSDLCTHV